MKFGELSEYEQTVLKGLKSIETKMANTTKEVQELRQEVHSLRQENEMLKQEVIKIKVNVEPETIKSVCELAIRETTLTRAEWDEFFSVLGRNFNGITKSFNGIHDFFVETKELIKSESDRIIGLSGGSSRKNGMYS